MNPYMQLGLKEQLIWIKIGHTSLLTTQTCSMWPMYWRAGMPPRGAWAAWRGGPVLTSGSSTGSNGKSCIWVRAIPDRLVKEWIESHTGEEDLGILLHKKLTVT